MSNYKEKLLKLGKRILTSYFSDDFNLSENSLDPQSLNIILNLKKSGLSDVLYENHINYRVYKITIPLEDEKKIIPKFFEELAHIIYHEYKKQNETLRTLRDKIYFLSEHEYVALLGRKYFEKQYGYEDVVINNRKLLEDLEKAINDFKTLIFGNYYTLNYSRFKKFEKEIPDILAHIIANLSYKEGEEEKFNQYIIGNNEEHKIVEETFKKYGIYENIESLRKYPADLTIKNLLIDPSTYFDNFYDIYYQLKSKLESSNL